MESVKANEVQICIFTPKGFDSISQYPADERAMFEAFAGVIQDLRIKHGSDVPVYLEYCPLTYDTNQILVAQWGMNDLPAVQVLATYPDGKIAKYALTKDVQDKLTGVNWTPDDVRPYVEAVLYQRDPAQKSWLCEIFPPLCSIGGWVWLSAAVFTTWKLTQAKDNGKILWGAGAGLCWQSFFAGGGFKKIGL